MQTCRIISVCVIDICKNIENLKTFVAVKTFQDQKLSHFKFHLICHMKNIETSNYWLVLYFLTVTYFAWNLIFVAVNSKLLKKLEVWLMTYYKQIITITFKISEINFLKSNWNLCDWNYSFRSQSKKCPSPRNFIITNINSFTFVFFDLLIFISW